MQHTASPIGRVRSGTKVLLKGRFPHPGFYHLVKLGVIPGGIEFPYGVVAAQIEPESGAAPGAYPGPDADGERSCAQQARTEGDDRCRDGGKPRPGRDRRIGSDAGPGGGARGEAGTWSGRTSGPAQGSV